MRFLKIFLPMVAIDILLLLLWKNGISQESTTTVYAVTVVPVIFTANLIAAGVVHLLGKKELIKYFILNAIVASAIFYAFFVISVRKFNRENYSTWYFERADTTFVINHELKTDSFYITTKVGPSTSLSFMKGTVSKTTDGLEFKSDSLVLNLRALQLFGFPGNTDFIEVKKADE
jgi:hypothetical protein